MKIKYNKLLIRNAEASDAIQLCQWWNSGEVMKWVGFPKGLGKTVEEVQSKIESYSDEKGRLLLIEYQGAPIGELYYDNLGQQVAEIHIKICVSDFREKGIGRLALSLLVKELFKKAYKKILISVDLKNTRAQHVYELLGFKMTVINYDSWMDQLGEKQSSIDYELIEEEFNDFSLQ
ncbi:GNAT family N-acetyltransferase [Facklamia sp. 7083-14-GEN3]|uniref:GNAT family N-acetyltransferase n=1 Tax=Facklamia sp. 7083-14-GEN3 TaxID=2973478 RepID=UPI00215CAA58|nr:GNAT family N-acetyltransferase [Facklamia sp. 7083-14-GEN3]MCR8968453.1 GNAT family N-acetyltransferase [Facklamia sp. 7083-14-GEN3]